MPCTLIRLAGCPLRCSYCDTPEAIPVQSGQMMELDDIMQRVRTSQRPLVLVTGGEPLAQRGIFELLKALSGQPAIVQLETSGAYDVHPVGPPVRRILDIKTPGSGECSRNRWSNLQDLRKGDELKFVLTDRADYEWMMDCLKRHAIDTSAIPVLLSPCWGLLDPKDVAQWILDDHLNVRLQLQMHKYVWGAEARKV
ncbi:MAG: radical SAM protein [Zetaproteobacteria bacterium]|nr:MAG: radical SAM protein [Zetaproteobacteria bacterium]